MQCASPDRNWQSGLKHIPAALLSYIGILNNQLQIDIKCQKQTVWESYGYIWTSCYESYDTDVSASYTTVMFLSLDPWCCQHLGWYQHRSWQREPYIDDGGTAVAAIPRAVCVTPAPGAVIHRPATHPRSHGGRPQLATLSVSVIHVAVSLVNES